jgi:hypothetical protein
LVNRMFTKSLYNKFVVNRNFLSILYMTANDVFHFSSCAIAILSFVNVTVLHFTKTVQNETSSLLLAGLCTVYFAAALCYLTSRLKEDRHKGL